MSTVKTTGFLPRGWGFNSLHLYVKHGTLVGLAVVPNNRSYGPVAPTVERVPCKHLVEGSNPFWSTLMYLNWIEHLATN